MRAPHSPQNDAPSPHSAPHLPHFIFVAADALVTSALGSVGETAGMSRATNPPAEVAGRRGGATPCAAAAAAASSGLPSASGASSPSGPLRKSREKKLIGALRESFDSR